MDIHFLLLRGHVEAPGKDPSHRPAILQTVGASCERVSPTRDS